ncbi:hypothetical protein IU454_08070 [Nocardia farcinica]|uniref:hypothetical protein n=1 Tax=Nocardia farcinica TaxID=37329 RepID=UPI0018961604|nr:hypothetical protein [Nocardia farcinica]MBF6291819.1 hypothetical protein [Nocardia farcinica]
MTDNPHHMFIPRHDRKLLRDILAELPSLCDDLTIAVTKQARLGGRRLGKRKRVEEPLPYDPHAAEAAEALHAVLVGWVRLVCEHRAIDYAGPRSTAGLARWLHRHLIALAMTPGSETALSEIQEAKRAAETVVCPPPGIVPVADPVLLAQARRMHLNARGIATLARDLGEEYRHLTQRRVHVLHEAGLIAPLPGPWRPGWPQQYRVGDVLDAHLVLPIRQRHARHDERVSA